MTVTVNYKSAAVRMVHGTWTHTEGAAAESLTVAGYVYGGSVTNNDAAGTGDVNIGFSVSRSTTSGISTITIHNDSAVTLGRFMFWVSSQ